MRRLSVLIDYEAVLMRQRKQYHLKGKDADTYNMELVPGNFTNISGNFG